MANIDDFKANLIGGGARANQFRVTITPPAGIAIGLDVRRTSFLVTAAQLPASTLGEIAVPFRGRNIYVSGDRAAPETWDMTVYNDTDFMIRNAMERWQNGINDYANNTGVTNPSDYQTDLFVEQLDADGGLLEKWTLKNAIITSVDSGELSYEVETLSEITITVSYDEAELTD